MYISNYSQNVAFGDYASPAGGPPPAASELASLARTPSCSLRSHSAPLRCTTTSIGLGISYKPAYKCVMQNGLNWALSSAQDNQWLLPVTL